MRQQAHRVASENHGRRAIARVVSVAILAVGCATRTLEPVLVREPRPAPIGLAVGIYYPEELRSFVYHFPSRGGVLSDEWIEAKLNRPVAIGEASVTLLDRALALMFRDVVRVPERRSGDRTDLAGVIEPRIVTVAYSRSIPPTKGYIIGPTMSVAITYGFMLYSPMGDQLASWSVTGNVTSPYRAFSTEGFERAMRLAAWEFTSGFRSVPEVRRWLDERGIK